jgi:peptidoglycan hydrolase-like protein with peptidoglycan-binding domain
MHKLTTFALLILICLAPQYTHALEETANDIYCPAITKNIKKGYRDANSNGSVSELQQFLADYYDIEPGQVITGYFGNVTRGYVVRFQTEQNFAADARFGIVGTLTRARIATICTGAPAVFTSTTPAPLTCPAIAQPVCTNGTLAPVSVNGCVYYTCTQGPAPVVCTPLAPETQTVSCPAGQTGSSTQTRTSTCASGATTPTWRLPRIRVVPLQQLHVRLVPKQLPAAPLLQPTKPQVSQLQRHVRQRYEHAQMAH